MLDIQRLCKIWNLPVHTFFDVGANTGQTSKSALSSFNQAKIFAFEPDPDIFSALSANLYGSLRFTGYNLALSNVQGAVPFFRYGSSRLGSLVPDAQYPARKGVHPKQIAVECTTLDEFCASERVQEIDVLKIDVEGCDLLVLRGAERLLSQGAVRFVYIEFNDMSERPGSTGGALTPISDFLAPFGFRFIATYPDHMEFGEEMHVGANALFFHPPTVSTVD
jgi:FkbM family methyltransferase